MIELDPQAGGETGPATLGIAEALRDAVPAAALVLVKNSGIGQVHGPELLVVPKDVGLGPALFLAQPLDQAQRLSRLAVEHGDHPNAGLAREALEDRISKHRIMGAVDDHAAGRATEQELPRHQHGERCDQDEEKLFHGG